MHYMYSLVSTLVLFVTFAHAGKVIKMSDAAALEQRLSKVVDVQFLADSQIVPALAGKRLHPDCVITIVNECILDCALRNMKDLTLTRHALQNEAKMIRAIFHGRPAATERALNTFRTRRGK